MKKDWFSLTTENLEELALNHYFLSDIKEMKKTKFKKLVKLKLK